MIPPVVVSPAALTGGVPPSMLRHMSTDSASTLSRRPADYHMHTPLCKHATGTPGQFWQTAAAQGLREIAFTDHSPDPSGYDAAYRMEVDQFEEYRRMVRPLQDGRTPPVLFGIEAEYYPAAERYLAEWLPQGNFDVILGSVHYLGDWGFDNPDYRHIWNSVDIKAAWQTYMELMIKLVGSGLFDVIGHFDLPKKFGHRLRDRDLKEMVQPVLDHVMKSGLAIEINTAGWRKEVGEAYPSPLILYLAHERGIPICFGSDAHEPENVGYRFDDAVRLAQEAGYTESVVFRGRQRQSLPLPSV